MLQPDDSSHVAVAVTVLVVVMPLLLLLLFGVVILCRLLCVPYRCVLRHIHIELCVYV